MGVRTVMLKLHNPSHAKRQIIDNALSGYNAALQYLTDQACPCLTELEKRYKRENGQYDTLGLSKWIDKDMSEQLNRMGVQPFKDALRLDFAATLESWFRQGVQHRTKAKTPSWAQARSLLQGDGKNIDTGHLRPIYFCRYDTKRSYCLLYNREKDRFYAKLYLQNGASAQKPVHRPGQANGGELMHIHPDAGMLKRTGRKETFIVVPLAFGKWQEEIIKEAAKAPERFKTARLIKKNEAYYLAVSVEYGEEKNVLPSTFIGISRGLKNRLNYTVTGADGGLLEEGAIGCAGEGLRSPKPLLADGAGMPLNELHAAANALAAIASDYSAQVIAADMTRKTDGLLMTPNMNEQCRPVYKRRDYNQLVRLTDYKLMWRGLPKSIKVSPVGIFHTCPQCGRYTRRNRLNGEVFICTDCGTAMDIDKLGSFNLSKKLIAYKATKIKIKLVKNDEGIIFSNKILGLHCFSRHDEFPLEKLKSELAKIIRGAPGNADTDTAAKSSLISKLTRADDYMELLEFV